MITIKKQELIPPVLSTKGVTENAKNCSLYEATPMDYHTNKSKFDFSRRIYNHPSIKEILREAQDIKCCFCEKLQHDLDGAIEHYRPKAGYKSIRKDKLKKPGYYWLGYVWDNLFFICKACNGKKGTIFPLEDERKRVENHTKDISDERPLILNPTGTGEKDPRKHIVFDNEFVRGVSDEGRATVEACKLDRAGLDIKRRVLINELFDRIILITNNLDNLDAPDAKRAILYLKNSMKKESPFSAMAIDYIRKEFPILIT